MGGVARKQKRNGNCMAAAAAGRHSLMAPAAVCGAAYSDTPSAAKSMPFLELSQVAVWQKSLNCAAFPAPGKAEMAKEGRRCSGGGTHLAWCCCQRRHRVKEPQSGSE